MTIVLKSDSSSVNIYKGDYKIIVVEDDKGLNRLIQKKLQKEGYKTEGVLTGQEALAKTSGNENEVLLIDYKLPDMTGKQLTIELIKKYNSVPSIIVITGFGDEKIAVEMMKLGVWDYMVKEPDFIDILPEKIKHICADIEKNNKLEKAEEDLRKNLEILNDTGEMARVGGWELDLEKNKVYWTQSTKKIHEVAPDYVPRLEEAINFYPKESGPIIEKHIDRALKEGKAYDIEIPIITAKGNKLWTHSIGTPEMQDGKCIRLRGTFQDITERKKAEERIKFKQEKLKRTEKIARVGSWDWDIASDTVSWSDELFQIFKLNPEMGAVSYTDHPKIYTPESMQRLDTAVKHAIEKGESYEIDLEIIRGDGTNAFCTARGLAKKDKKGKVIQLFGSLQDITERKKAEERLKKSEERIKIVIDNSPFPVAVVDEKDQKIQYWSKSAIKLFGHNPKSTEEWYALAYPDPEYRSEVIERWKPFLETAQNSKKAVNTGEYNIVCKNGSVKICELYAQSIPGSLVVTLNDITERKKAEEQLKALNQQLVANQQELKAANQQLQANEQQLRAANQQLQANEQELKAANQQLQANEQQLRATVQQLQAGEQQLRAANKQLQASEQQLKASNESLIKSEKQYRNLFNSIQEGVYLHSMVYDNQGCACNYRIIQANPMSQKVLNIKSEDAIGKLATDLYGTEKAPFIEVYAKVAETGEPVSFEQYFEPMNKHFLISVFSPQKGEFATAFLDITERKKAEQQIKESEEKYRALYKNAPLAYQSLNINGNIKDINPQWLKTMHYTREEVIGKWFGDFLTPDYKEHFRKNFQRFKKKGTVSGVEFKMLRGDNTEITVSFEGCIGYDDKGNFKQTYCTFKDITQQKKAELELIKAKEKAEEADRLKSAFLANMSHEIRTPMNGILGFTNLLQEPNLSGEEQQNYIDIIKKSGDRMLNTVNDIIDISRIESGIVELSVSEVNINKQLKDLHSFFKSEAEKKGIQLVLKADTSKQDLCIQTDRDKFNSIVTNLVKNAIKFTYRGTIQMGYAIKNKNESAEVEFYVKDTGIGIPKNRQQAIFDRFIQADIEDKNARQGSGLGLAISKAYTEIMGGLMWVESEEDLGSTFYFTIPYTSKKEKKSGINRVENSDNTNDKFKNLNILIAEDDNTSEMLLKLTIKPLAKNILVSRTGVETVEVCRNNPDIDLILMDIQMPDMNGYEATRQIRQFNSEIIIIAQTAFALAGDKEKALEAGCNAYIKKPIKKSELQSLLRKYSR